MDAISNAIEQLYEQGDVRINLAGMDDSDSSLTLKICLYTDPAPDAAQPWEVQCTYPQRRLIRHVTFDQMTVHDDHVLLWDYCQDWVHVSFKGRPANVRTAVGALYEAHVSVVGDWVPFNTYFNHLYKPCGKLLDAGSGMLARGPLRLIERYADTLKALGVRASIVADQRPFVWKDGRWQTATSPLRLLLLENTWQECAFSYVVAESFSGARVDV